MTKVVNISKRGTLTLPKEFRQRFGIPNSGRIVVEETSNGLLLRPDVSLPVEIYSEKRVAEFARSNERALAGYRLKQ